MNIIYNYFFNYEEDSKPKIYVNRIGKFKPKIAGVSSYDTFQWFGATTEPIEIHTNECKEWIYNLTNILETKKEMLEKIDGQF